MLAHFLALMLTLAPIPAPREDPFGRGFLGIRVQPGQMAISSIEPKSASERVGLQPGDVFVSVAGVAVQNYEQVTALIRSCRPGAVLDLEMRRGEKTMKYAAVLTARPASADLPLTLP